MQGVVHHDRQVVGDAHVLARQDHVPFAGGVGGDLTVLAARALAGLVEDQVLAAVEDHARPLQRQPPGEGSLLGEQGGLLVRRRGGAPEHGPGPVLARPVRRRGDGVQHLAPGTEAAVEQALAAETGEGGVVVGHVLGLAAHRCGPSEAEPGQVLMDRRLEGWAAAGSVDVLDAQQEPATGCAGGVEGAEGRVGVA